MFFEKLLLQKKYHILHSINFIFLYFIFFLLFFFASSSFGLWVLKIKKKIKNNLIYLQYSKKNLKNAKKYFNFCLCQIQEFKGVGLFDSGGH